MKPPFIDYPGNIVLSHPVQEKYTQIYSFLVTGNMEAMQLTVDQRLNFMNDRPDTKYIVASDKIMLSYTYSSNGHSLASDIKMGYASEKALLTFIILAECKRDGDQWDAQRLFLFAPFTFVDNPLSMAVGRETYGFPKSIGILDMPEDPNFVYNFSLSALAFKHFNPEERAFMQPLLNINRQIVETKEEDEAIHDSLAMWKRISSKMKPTNDDFHKGIKFYINEMKDLWNLEVPLVFLRQFRDIADASKACYQAIMEVNGHVDAFRGASIYSSKFIVKFNDVATYPICTALGIPFISEADWAFMVDIDLSFGKGVEVYRSI
jgi:hypothetical protein